MNRLHIDRVKQVRMECPSRSVFEPPKFTRLALECPDLSKCYFNPPSRRLSPRLSMYLDILLNPKASILTLNASATSINLPPLPRQFTLIEHLLVGYFYGLSPF